MTAPITSVRNQNGFTLIELMIVVVIIGILAAIALPRFSGVARMSKEAEAVLLLKQVHTLQQTHFDRHSYYAATMEELRPFGWAPPEGRYFDMPEITDGGGPGATTYTVCMAALEDRLEGRSIDQDGVLGTCGE